jgi:hypothetical protein
MCGKSACGKSADKDHIDSTAKSLLIGFVRTGNRATGQSRSFKNRTSRGAMKPE